MFGSEFLESKGFRWIEFSGDLKVWISCSFARPSKLLY